MSRLRRLVDVHGCTRLEIRRIVSAISHSYSFQSTAFYARLELQELGVLILVIFRIVANDVYQRPRLP